MERSELEKTAWFKNWYVKDLVRRLVWTFYSVKPIPKCPQGLGDLCSGPSESSRSIFHTNCLSRVG